MLWPNGTLNSRFEDKANQRLVAEQSLKGLVSVLFAWNGREFAFVTDCIWRSPLGLKINGQSTAGVGQTEDWVKIRGDQLAAKDGMYDLRVTANCGKRTFSTI
jgi:hypothetical protein